MGPPGMLYVTMEPWDKVHNQFHDWYNNEHGPLRVRKPDIFSNGLRYVATDDIKPSFLAMYDVTDMDKLTTPAYTSLRAKRSSREEGVISRIRVERHFYELDSVRQAPDFVPAEQLPDADAEGRILVAVEVSLNNEEGAAAAVTKWYEEEHIEMLSKVPGWLRTRRYSMSPLEEPPFSRQRIVTLHEYAKENGLGGPEHMASMDTPWRTDVFSNYITTHGQRIYSLFYVFGPVPRDLHSLSGLPEDTEHFPFDMAVTKSGSAPIINAHVTTSDKLIIVYQLEGSPSQNAPTVAFCNSLLTTMAMWDPFVEILKMRRPDLRILRYNARGRQDIHSPAVPATMKILVEDLNTLLVALRCSKLHALIGVSVGGATALSFALKYPSKLERFVACDFNVAGSEANTQAWKDRIAIAETQGMEPLASRTVERWFHPNTVAEKKDVSEWMRKMVAHNDVQGFKFGCQALWNYDLKPELQLCCVPGLLIVGEGDGKGALVKAMEGFKDMVGRKGAELKVVPNTGHLPMCEDPQAFWENVKSFI